MSRAGAIGLLFILLAVSGVSLLLAPDVHGLIVVGILIGSWFGAVGLSVVEHRAGS